MLFLFHSSVKWNENMFGRGGGENSCKKNVLHKFGGVMFVDEGKW